MEGMQLKFRYLSVIIAMTLGNSMIYGSADHSSLPVSTFYFSSVSDAFYFKVKRPVKDGNDLNFNNIVHFIHEETGMAIPARVEEMMYEDSLYVKVTGFSEEGKYSGMIDLHDKAMVLLYAWKLPKITVSKPSGYKPKFTTSDRIDWEMSIRNESSAKSRIMGGYATIWDADTYDTVYAQAVMWSNELTKMDSLVQFIPDELHLLAGTYDAQFAMVDDHDNLHRESITFSVKDARWPWPIITWVSAVLIGLVMQWLIRDEDRMSLKKKANGLLKIVVFDQKNNNNVQLQSIAKKLIGLLELLAIKGTSIPVLQALYEDIETSYEEHTQLKLQSKNRQPDGNKKRLSSREMLYYGVTLLAVLLASVGLFYYFYERDDIFGHACHYDYLLLFLSIVVTIAGAKFILSETLELLPKLNS